MLMLKNGASELLLALGAGKKHLLALFLRRRRFFRSLRAKTDDGKKTKEFVDDGFAFVLRVPPFFRFLLVCLVGDEMKGRIRL
jgi:hypothetical protein